jgi:hypothetical protein
MIFGVWNVRGMCRSGSITTVARELTRYKLDLVGVQEIRSDKGHCKIRGLFSFYGKEMKIIKWEQKFCTPQNIIGSYKSRVC